MNIKRKAVFLAILPSILSGYSLNAEASYIGGGFNFFLADGLTPNTPLLPDPESTHEGLFEFTFNSNGTGFTFIDPDVAVGYDYEIITGSNFTSILLPDNIGDNQFDLWLFDETLNVFVDTNENLTGGIAYDLAPGGVDIFRILGIETAELLDPNNPYAFVTGLQFANPGDLVNMTQTAITEFVADTNNGPIPEPTTLVLLLSGIGLLARQRKA